MSNSTRAQQIASLIPEDASADAIGERMIALLGNAAERLLDVEMRPELYPTAYPMLRSFKGTRGWLDAPTGDAAAARLCEIVEIAERDREAGIDVLVDPPVAP